MSDLVFSSLNPYENMEVILDRSPQGLIKRLKEIRTPIKIVAIVPYGLSHAAYIVGDIRANEPKGKKTLNEKGDK